MTRISTLLLMCVLLLSATACGGAPTPASSTTAVMSVAVTTTASESEIIFRQQVFAAEKSVSELIGEYGITFTDEELELPYRLIFDKVTKSDRIEQSVLTGYQSILAGVSRGTKITLSAEQLFMLEAFTQLDIPFYLDSVRNQEMTACYTNKGDAYLVIESEKLRFSTDA